MICMAYFKSLSWMHDAWTAVARQEGMLIGAQGALGILIGLADACISTYGNKVLPVSSFTSKVW